MRNFVVDTDRLVERVERVDYALREQARQRRPKEGGFPRFDDVHKSPQTDYTVK